MTTAGQQLRSTIVGAIQASSTCAAQAGLTLAAWGSTTTPHVFDAGGGVALGHKNRGRLPFVEVYLEPVSTTMDSSGGAGAGFSGTQVSHVRLRAHVTGAQLSTATTMAEGILRACLAAIRNTGDASYPYMAWGTQNDLEPFKIGPLWHTQDAVLTVEHSADLSTFELQ